VRSEKGEGRREERISGDQGIRGTGKNKG